MTDTTQSQPLGRLLVVDDEPEMVQFLATALEQHGYAVTGLTSSLAALETLRGGDFDVLLTDLRLPELDGLELLRAALEIDPNLVGVIMTGRAGVPTAVQALQLGAFDYIRKPFELKNVVPVLQRALELRRVRRENLQLRETVALHAFSQAISATLEPAAVAEQMAAAAVQHLGADEATVLSLAPGDDALVITGVAGRQPRAELVGQRVPLTASIAGWIARQGQALVLNGAVDDPRFAALFPRPEISSAIALPLLAGGQVIGVLTVNALAPRRPFRSGQVHALNILANAGAAALQNAALVSQLRASELRFRELFEQASDGIVLLDEHGVCLAANARLTEWLGYAAGALTGRSLRSVLLDEDRPALRQDFAELRAGRLIRGERRLRRQDGTVLPVELTARRAPDGTFQAIVRDVTARQQADQALRASEARYREVIEHANDGIVTVSAAGDYMEANSVLLQWLGYTRAELLRLNTRDVVVADDQAQLQRDFAAWTGGQTVLAQRRLRRRDGTILTVELTGRRLPDGGFQAFMRDITQRLQAEAALRASEAKFRAVVENSHDGILFVDVDDTILFRSASFDKINGYTSAERLGQRAYTTVHPDDLVIVQDMWAELRAHPDQVQRREYRIHHKDGSWRWIETSMQNLLDQAEVRAFVVNSRDISDRKRAEEAQRDSETRLAALFQASPAAIAVTTQADGRFVDVNAGFERLTGYTRAETIGRTLAELNLLADLAARQPIREALAQRRAFHNLEVRLRRQSGELVIGLLSNEHVELGGVPHVVNLVLDITDRKRAEQAQRESEARFAAVFHASPAAITLTSLADGRILDVNDRFERSLGYSRTEAVGRTVAELGSWVDPAQRPTIIAQLAEHGAVHNVEVRFRRRSGEVFDGLLSMEQIELAGQACVLSLVLDITDRKQAEQARRASETRFATLFNASPVPTTLSTSDGRIVDVNQAFERAMGYTRAEVLGQHAAGLGTWANAEDRAQLMQRLTEQGALSGVEVTFRRKSGAAMLALASYETVELDGERYVLTLALDITDRQQAEQALRDNELRLRVALKGVDIAVFNLDRELRYTWMYNAQLGYAAEQVLGHTDVELLPPGDGALIQGIKQHVLETGQGARAEVTVHRPPGPEIFDLIVEPLFDRHGAVSGLAGATINITERQRAEDQLRFQSRLLESVGQAVIATDLDGRILYWNRMAESLYGWTAAEALGRDILTITPSTASREQGRTIMQQLQAGESWSGEYTVQRRDGTAFPALVTNTPFYDRHGALAGIIGLSTDISDRRRAEQALRESETRLAAVFQASPAAIAVVTLTEGRYLDVNVQYERLVGYTRAEIIGHLVGELNIYLTASDRQTMVDQVQQHGVVHNLAQRLRRKAGEIIDVVMSVERVELGGVACLVGLVLDVTDQKRAEDQLRFQAGLLGAVGQAVVATDLNAIIRYWNHSAEKLFGWTAGEALGRHVTEVLPTTISAEQISENTRSLQAGESWTGEFSVINRAGHRIPILATSTPFYDGHGALAGLIGLSTDISERKQREREMETISQISAALRGALTAAQIPVVILDQLGALFSVDAAGLSRLDAAHGEVWVAHATGLWTPGLGARQPADIGLVGRVLATGQPYLTNDVPHEPLIYPPQSADGLSAVVVLPLIAHGQTIGALAAGRQTPFAEGDLPLLSSIADITANALQRSTLHEQTRLRADQLAALNALARALAETLQLEHIYERLEAATRQLLPAVDSVAVSLYDPDQHQLTEVYRARGGRRLAADEPLGALDARALSAPVEVAKARRPLTLNPAGGPASVLAPLLVKGEVIGVLQAHSPSGPNLGQEAADLLATVASTAAVAIENARLFAETQRRLLRLQALRTIDLAITSSMDSRISLRVLADQATTHLGVDTVDVLLLDQESHRLELAVGRGFKSPPPRFAMRVDESLAGRAVLERRLVHVPELAGQRTHPAREVWIKAEGFVAYWGMPLVAKGQVRGVLELFLRAPLTPDGEWLDFLETLGEQAAIAVENSGLFADLQRSNTDLELAYDTTLEGWSRALDLRDKETEGHTQRVTELTERLARTMGLNESELVHIRRGSLLHDIGKMGIPDSILLKAGPLSAEEWDIMRQHPRYAFELLTPIAYLRTALDIPYCHHEKWDGSGYPRGLKGEQIPLAARVFAVVDVWDALRSDRPYRPGWAEAKIIDYLRANSGTHFDPRVVPAFLQLLEQP